MAKSKEPSAKDAPPSELGPFRKFVLFTITGVLGLSVAARAVVGGSEPAQDVDGAAAAPALGSSLVDGGTGAPEGGASAAAEPGAIEELLPFFTETSFFALIGFALGYATRKIVKLMLIFVAIFFAGLQGLVYAGVADVDWGQAIDLLNTLILNVKEDQTLTEIARAKLPSFGGLAGGYVLGFRRG